MEYFANSGWRHYWLTRAADITKETWAKFYKPPEDLSAPDQTDEPDSTGTFHQNVYANMHQSFVDLRDELQQYLNEPAVNNALLTTNKVDDALGCRKVRVSQYLMNVTHNYV